MRRKGKSKIIGRDKEIALFNEIITSKQAEFIAIYGRRRIGKTFLVRESIAKEGIYLECTGVKDGLIQEQLTNFAKAFSKTFYPNISIKTPKNWREAFEMLTNEIEKVAPQKIIVFLDELPWLATQKSGLLQNLDYFWNTTWSKLPNLKLIVCGSAASWILNNLINGKGGLHNRLTKTILLQPFTLAETKQLFVAQGCKFSNKNILDIYMAMGGVPYYLVQVKKNKSVTQNINDICFTQDGLLYTEFTRLFKSLFNAAELNLLLVREIAKKHYGISMLELVKKVGKKVGGRFQERLNELEAAGFIKKFLPYGRKSRDHYYKVIDEYTLFYLRWIEDIANKNALPLTHNYWGQTTNTPKWYSWAGYAFENICYKHIDKIIIALGLAKVICLVGNWRYIPEKVDDQAGAQIDLLIDRNDDAISLCEIKYSENKFALDKEYAQKLVAKMDVLQKNLPTKKQIFLVMITTSGLKRNVWSEDLINDVVELDDLF